MPNSLGCDNDGDKPVISWQALGKHRFRIEEDLILIEFHSTISLAEMQALYEMLPPIYADYGRAFFICDLRDSELPSAAVRSWSAEWNRTHHELTAGAAFGAGLAARAMFLLMARAMEMVSKRRLPAALFATEQQARKWIDELRREVVEESR